MYVCNTTKGGCKKVSSCKGDNCHEKLKECKDNCVPLYKDAVAEKCEIVKYGRCSGRTDEWCECSAYGTDSSFKVPIWVWIVGGILLFFAIVVALLDSGSKKKSGLGSDLHNLGTAMAEVF